MEFPAARRSGSRDPADDTPPESAIRDRLRAVMAFRVLIVTALLGGALAIDVETFSALSDARNLILLGLIVGTYGLTIVYSLLLNRLDELHRLASGQLSVDLVLITILVGVTGGFGSVFTLLYYLSIINAALVLGRRSALITATATSAALIFFASTGGWFETASPAYEQMQRGFMPLYFEVGVNCAAAFLIALLGGALSDRLGQATEQLEQRRQDLKELRALNRNILQSLSSGLLTVDENNRIIFANQSAADMTGISEDELLGARLEETLPSAADTIERGDTIPPADEVPSPEHRFETDFERPDGDVRRLGFSVSILRDDQRRDVGRIIVFQDLTDIRRMEREMRRSERLAAIGKLAASIAHEIRNPLASISGSVEMLDETVETDGAGNLMKIILREVERLDDLITEFLEYSRPSSISRESTDLRKLIFEVLELFKNREESVDVTVTVEGEETPLEATDADNADWTADVDAEAIRQVLWNLLNNARDAMAELKADDRRVLVELTKDSQQIRFAVEDNGPGIEEDIREDIFQPFFTTREEGSGLGLATSYRLIDEHDGRLAIDESNVLSGARLVVELTREPATESRVVAGTEHEESAPTQTTATTSSSGGSP